MNIPRRLTGQSAIIAVLSSLLYLSAVASFGRGGPPPLPPIPEAALNFWPLEAAPWDSFFGDLPSAYTNLNTAPSWDYDGTALSVDTNSPAFLQLNAVQDNGTNITLDSGSLSVWVQANWTSVADGGAGPGDWATIWDIGHYTTNASTGAWLLAVDPSGSNLIWVAQSAGTNQVMRVPIDFDAGDWHCVATAWSLSNFCLYLDGQLATHSGPLACRPSDQECAQDGFCVGSIAASGADAGTCQFQGQLQWLASYDYPLSAEEVSADYASVSTYMAYWGSSAATVGGFHAADDSSGPPSLGGDNGGGSTNAAPAFSYTNTISTNGLWMAVTGISNGTVSLSLNNATNYVYEVFSTTDLTQPWNIETEVFPGSNCTVTPFTMEQAARNNLFLWARDWTGITSNGNQTPDWWFWYWFGKLGLSDTNLDSQGNPLLSDYQYGNDPNIISFSLTATNQYINTGSVQMQNTVTAGIPFYMAALVDDTNLADADWIPYNSNITVSVGTTEGWHHIRVGLRGLPPSATQTWDWYRVKMLTTPPLLVITNPVSANVMQPMIEVQGYCTEAMASLTYDLSNPAGLSTNLQAFVIDQYYSTNTWESTTNTFQAFDVLLTNGANVLTFHATDLAGNITTTNFTYTLSYASRTNPPVVQLYWPQDGTQISGSKFTIRGCLDDFTTTVQATIVDSNGDTNTANAIVERNGNFWIDNLPLAGGLNQVTLTAIDAASNVATTNITVTGSSLVLTMNPINSSQLWQVTEDVSGTISDPTMSVWVNGVEATTNGDGTWDASGVPTTTGGTVVFQVRAIPNSGNGSNALGGGAFSLANLCNPTPPSPLDVEMVQDRPARLYVSNCTFAITNSYADQISTDIGTWSDLTGGSENYNFIDYGYPWTCQQQIVCPASYWPNPAAGTDFITDTYWVGTTWVGTYTNQFACGPTIFLEHSDFNGASPYLGYSPYCPTCPFPTHNYVRQSQCVMQFEAYGGRAIPGAQTLWQFTCSAADMLSAKPIAPQSITMGNLGPLDARGNLFVALPSGATTVVTPQTPGRQWYTFNPTATQIPVTLTANGYDLSQTNPTFCVGQQIKFNLSCPGLPMTNVSCNWTLGGNFVNAASTNSAGCVTYTTASSLLQGPHTSCQCWYVSGSSGTVNVGLNVIVDGKSLSTAAMGTFSIYRPTAKMVSIEEPRHFTITNNTGITSKLQLGDAAGNGCMYYTVEVDSTPPNANPHFYGQADITQLVTLDYSDPAFWCSGYCDGTEFYMLNPQRVVSVGLVSLSDGPAEIWDSPNIVNISAQDFIRFQPDGANSIWVTLGIATWDAVGIAEQGLGVGWTLTTDVSPDPTGPDNSDAFPVWTASVGAH